MEYLEKLKDNLEHFKYPHIDSLTDIEVAELFSLKNKLNLIEWILNQISVTIIPEEGKNRENKIVQILWENGLISKTEMKPFLKHNLLPDKEVEIFLRIFNFAKMIQVSFDISNELEEIEVEELEEILETDFETHTSENNVSLVEDRDFSTTEGIIRSESNSVLLEESKTEFDIMESGYFEEARKDIDTFVSGGCGKPNIHYGNKFIDVKEFKEEINTCFSNISDLLQHIQYKIEMTEDTNKDTSDCCEQDTDIDDWISSITQLCTQFEEEVDIQDEN